MIREVGIVLVALTVAAISTTTKQQYLAHQHGVVQQRMAQTIPECKQRLQNKVYLCDYEFKKTGSVYYQNLKFHNECLNGAKAEFDNCLKAARENSKSKG